MSTPEFAVWKNAVFSKLGKFDATLQKAEEFLDALYKVYNPVCLDSDDPKNWRVEQSKKKWNKCDDVNHIWTPIYPTNEYRFLHFRN